MVRRCNHAQYLRFLLTLSHCGLSDCCLPFVRVIPVTAGKPHLVNSVCFRREHILEHSVSIAWGLGLCLHRQRAPAQHDHCSAPFCLSTSESSCISSAKDSQQASLPSLLTVDPLSPRLANQIGRHTPPPRRSCLVPPCPLSERAPGGPREQLER